MDFSTDFSAFSNAFFSDFGTMGSSQLTIVESANLVPDTFEFPRITKHMLSIVCIEGSITLLYDDIEREIPAKSLLGLLAGHTIQGYRATDDFVGFMILSSVDQLNHIMPLMSRMLLCSLHFEEEPVVKLTDEELRCQILFRDLISHKMKDGNSMFDSVVVGKLCEGIYCETINIYFSRINDGSLMQCRRRESIFYNFVLAVENNFKKERSIAFYADSLCITPKHLSSVVKEITGKTPTKWIDSYVVAEIKRLLENTELTIQEISVRLNFANQSFLGKYFKNHTGQSPREYRSNIFKS